MAGKTTAPRRNQRSTRSRVTNRRARYDAATRRKIRQARPLHKKFLLHPASVFMLLCAGVFICGWTYRVIAATIISSVIEAPPLQSAATITSPLNNATINSLPIYVNGYCPTNSYVILQINGTFDGVSWCGPDNTYTIESSLFSGVNALTVQDYNQTDLAGPTGPGIKVNYQPPETASSSQANGGATHQPSAEQRSAGASGNSTTPGNPSTTAQPVVLISNFKFKTFSAEKTFSWPIDLEGGTPPYKVHVSWGDGMASNLSFQTDPAFTIHHTFQTGGYYAIVVTSTDTTGQTVVMQLAALINNANGKSSFIAPITSNHKPTPRSGLISKTAQHWLLIIWPSYVIIALMAVSFWLGERQEYGVLRTSHR